MSYTTIRARVRDLVQNPMTSVVTQMSNDTDTDTVEHRAIQGALQRFSSDRPRRFAARYAAAGGSTYEYALATVVSGWDDDWAIDAVVYPTGRQDRNPLPRDSWEVYRRHEDGAWYLRFLDDVPASGDYFGLEGRKPHVLADGTDSITADNPRDVDAFCKLAAAEMCELIATNFAAKAQSTVGVDSLNAQSQSGTFAARAKTYREQYEAHVKSRPRASGQFVNWHAALTGGADGMFHRKRFT